MKLILQKLRMINFKGQRDTTVSFNEKETTISGDNGAGKSTVNAAFCWLFTGKDQYDSAEINKIKTRDESGNHIEKLSHSVEAELLLDGEPLTIKRVLVQNWVKRRGETETVLDGHKTEYYINGVACGTEKAFREELDKIVDEQTFKLVTNPLYFTRILDWKQRREILFRIAPPITDEEVVKKISLVHSKGDIEVLAKILNSGVPLDRQKAELAAKKKQSREQLALIPAKIEATMLAKPEVPDGGFEVVEARVKQLQKQLEEIDAQLTDKAKEYDLKNSKRIEKQQKIHDLRMALQAATHSRQSKRAEQRNAMLVSIGTIEADLKAEERKLNALKKEEAEITKELADLERRKEFAERQKPVLNERREKLIREFKEVDALAFTVNPEDISCPTCGREFEGDNLNEKLDALKKTFNANKSKKLDAIDLNGKMIRQDMEAYEDVIRDFDEKQAEKVEKGLEVSEKQVEVNDAIRMIQERLTAESLKLKEFDAAVIPPSDNEVRIEAEIKAEDRPEEAEEAREDADLKESKGSIQREIDSLKNALSRREHIEKSDRLIAGYEEEERKLAQDVAAIEKVEDVLSEFTRTRIESIEQRVNEMFALVKFRLFDVKLNGEEKECCDAVEPNGTPVVDTNTAMQVNCGIDIINLLNRHFGIVMPIIIDNRESISKIIDTDSQIVNLVKVKGQSTLKIE